MPGPPRRPRRLFGTDGVRGVANLDLGFPLAFGLGRAAGEPIGGRGPVLVGRDPRRSGEMLSAGLQAGFHSVGVDTVDAGMIPVGGVSALIPELDARLGVMVSASHNPAPDNGFKFFDSRGAKLDDDAEAAIEARLERGAPWAAPAGAGIGVRRPLPDAVDRYLAGIIRQARPGVFSGLRLALDCANGAASGAARLLFEELGADVEEHFGAPDGMNINEGCGATKPESLAELAGGRIGLCFDGDADRLIAVDEDGRPANGDVILAVIARHLHRRGELDRVAATVMSNLGFRRAMQQEGIELIETRVGDRYVLEAMLECGAFLGGEQSGHVISLDRAPTGDGLRTAVRLLEVAAASGLPLRDLRRRAIVEFPQVLENVPVRSKELEGAVRTWEAVRAVEAELGEDGRVLVRASGTEPVVRVMVEAPAIEAARTAARRLAAAVAADLG